MKKKRVISATSRPSSFKIPTTISNEMADFLGVAHGTQISRTEVNSRIHNYAISKNLRDEKDKRIIYPDNALMSLLRVKEGEKLGYFNIQKFVKGHFATRNSSPAYA